MSAFALIMTGCGGGSGGVGGGNPTTIGPNGGTVTCSDGKASVVIPAGALSQDVAISVEAIASPSSGNIGTVYNFAPDGTNFSLPVTISIQYDDAALPQGVSEQNLKLGTFVNNQWQEVAGSNVDTTLNIVSGSTSHFSPYSAFIGYGYSFLPKTGQTASYGTGDDGDLKKGVVWPSPRFTVSGDCVTDSLTGLMWVKSPDLTARIWPDALTYANGLSLCGYDDWRLPNVNEA